MLTSDYLESRWKKIIDISKLNEKYFLSENTETKLKRRKSKIFRIISNKRKQFLTNSPNFNLNLNNTANFLKIFNLIKSEEEKMNLINFLFTKDITNAKLILLKYEKVLNLNIDYNFLSTENFILDAIEQSDEIIKLIVKKKENINYLVKIMNLIQNENLPYDSSYVMITANLLILNEDINDIIKKEIDHTKIIQLIIKKETIMSLTYVFYIYAYSYFSDAKQTEKLEPLLDSIFWILSSKEKIENISMLYEIIYDIFILFSLVPKFGQKFFDNYELIFPKREFNINDILIEQKLLIISNLFKRLNSQKIKLFLQKDDGNILNFIYNSLKILSTISTGNNTLDKINIPLLSLSAKILLNITYYKELTNLLLENKEYLNMILSIFSYIISSKEINTIYDDALNNILKIVFNIISNKHKLFISYIISNNMHLGIKNKINYYVSCHFINEKIFISLMNIIGALFDSQTKDKMKTKFLKLDMDNNGFNNVIINAIVVFEKNEIIKKKCNEFCDKYYPNEPKENFVQLSNFDFFDLNL